MLFSAACSRKCLLALCSVRRIREGALEMLPNLLLAPRSSGELCLQAESYTRPLLLVARGCCRGRGTVQSSALFVLVSFPA